MHQYTIRSGEWRDADGRLLGVGHSGHGDAMNDPARCGEKDIGPIPPGVYVLGPAERHPTCGPVSMRLYPVTLSQVLGRSPFSFLVHGPNATPAPDDDSKGCPILPRPAREQLAVADDRLVEVVPGDGPIALARVEAEPVEFEGSVA